MKNKLLLLVVLMGILFLFLHRLSGGSSSESRELSPVVGYGNSETSDMRTTIRRDLENFTATEEVQSEAAIEVTIPIIATEASIPIPIATDRKEPYRWKERDRYYYPSIDAKTKEMVNATPTCIIKMLPNGQFEIPSTENELFITPMPVNNRILSWWKAIQRPKLMRVDPNLCDAVAFDKHPIFNRPGCSHFHLHPGAPRCQNDYLKWACYNSARAISDHVTTSFFILPESDHLTAKLPPEPYIITARNAFVSMCGDISSKCGLVRTTADCGAIQRKPSASSFYQNCPISLMSQENMSQAFDHGHTTLKGGMCMSGAPFSTEFDYHDKVFVVGQGDDSFFYDQHLEVMPRLAYHLEFLWAHPEIKIMVGCESGRNKNHTEWGLRHMLLSMEPLMKLAGLSMDRLVVHRHVFAREIYLPMEGGCQDPVYNTWQILSMRERFLNALNITRSPPPDVDNSMPIRNSSSSRHLLRHMNKKRRRKKLVMLLIKRSSGAKHTRNYEGGLTLRLWDDDFTKRLMRDLRTKFPAYNVKMFSDQDEKTMRCYPCQIRAFAEADVLIGMHGAGLSNQLYMKPNSAVVELCPYANDGRCLLGGGPFSRLAAVMSHNYMIHHPRKEEFKVIFRNKTNEGAYVPFVLSPTHPHIIFLWTIFNVITVPCFFVLSACFDLLP